jgi:hypothetical protein
MDTVFFDKPRSQPRPLASAPPASAASPADQVDRAARKLQGALMGHSQLNKKRTLYCVTPLPPEGHQREFLKKVFEHVHQRVGKALVFVELVSEGQGGPREFMFAEWIKVRLFRTQPRSP